MASVTSLDKDMRKLRLDRYTPQAANEVRAFIEESLGERLAPGDLMDALKDGVALCKLVNLAVPHPIRYKQKAVMPFVQMENISIFLDACKQPPLNLQNHDIFLTVDLYESKDPAQVLQCLGAFSRIAHQLQPSHFPSPVGGKSKAGILSPQGTGGAYNRARGLSNASNNSPSYNPSSTSYNPARPPSAMNAMRTGESNGGRWSPTKSPGPVSPGGGVSSWSKKSDEGATSPAWNIAQYGYMGGASQGNLGVSFGGRRQITSAGPSVPSMAEKEKKRKEKEAEEERMRVQQEEEEQRRLEERQAEEERARLEEERRWAEETRKLRDQEKRRAEEERRRWEEEERQWKLDEEQRQREEREAEARLEEERKKIGRGRSGSQLQGQYLSQYQAENGVSSESSRIKELERELERARERERQYERERLAKVSGRQAVENHDMNNRLKDEASSKARARSRSRPRLPSRKNSDEEWRNDEREYLRQQHKTHHANDTQQSRPLPEPQSPVRLVKNNTGPSSRPLPDPATYAASPKPNPTPKFSPGQNRTDRYLSSNPAPQQAQPKTTYSSEIGGFDSAAERDAEDRRRIASQKQTKAGGWASKSLLEREMEMERQRQQEWEESQRETKSKTATGNGVDGIGGGIGGKWDVNQWTGYTGGDGQNRGTQGIGSGRRQIVGPRPPPPGR